MTTTSTLPAERTGSALPASAGVLFRETMSGWFSLDATDPEEGARRGWLNGTRLTIRVSIRVPDLQAFLDDREHAAAIVGVVDFTPLGGRMRAERGDFRLFAPAGGGHLGDAIPGAKLMVYGLSFANDDGELHLAGRKVVRGRNPLRLWPETSTLYTTLHREGIGVGPVIGAGILRLGPLDFLGILPTLSAPGAADARARLGTLARFGRFFASELWDSYGRGQAMPNV